MFNKNCLVADLKRKCKEFKISYQGTKSELIKRLNKYISENGQAGEQSQVEDRDQIREDQEFSQVEINAPQFEFESDGEEVESINSNGKRTTDYQKKLFVLALSICTGETSEDFKFVFNSVNKYLYIVTNKELRKSIFEDIIQLQKSYCTELFEFGYKLFEYKWLNSSSSEIKNFISYFKKEWISSTNSGWYEGLTRGEHTPSTDNGVESINGKIKLLHTLRERLAVNSYLVNDIDSKKVPKFDLSLEILVIDGLEKFNENMFDRLSSL